jgi:hypothetical protein
MMFVEAYSQDEFLEAAKDASDFFIALDDAYLLHRQGQLHKNLGTEKEQKGCDKDKSVANV